MNPQQFQQQPIHPTSVVPDLNQHNTINQQPRTNGGGVWMKNPQAMSAGMQEPRDTTSAVSSTPSEYGSDDTSHRSPHADQNNDRPVADRDAFIQSDQSQQQWQSRMSPAERAKQLASEMDQNIERRRGSTGSIGEKILKIGGKKEYKLH